MALKLLCDLNKRVPSSEPFLSGIGQGYDQVLQMAYPVLVCYTAVFSVVTQRSFPLTH